VYKSEDKIMLNLIGWILKAIITIAIGIMGFTWEPKEELKPSPKKDERGDMTLPVFLHAPLERAIIIEAKNTVGTGNCTSAPRPAAMPLAPAAPKMPKTMRTYEISI
jgi:hypothetical protein